MMKRVRVCMCVKINELPHKEKGRLGKSLEGLTRGERGDGRGVLGFVGLCA